MRYCHFLCGTTSNKKNFSYSKKLLYLCTAKAVRTLESVCLCACEGQIFEKNKEKLAYIIFFGIILHSLSFCVYQESVSTTCYSCTKAEFEESQALERDLMSGRGAWLYSQLEKRARA